MENLSKHVLINSSVIRSLKKWGDGVEHSWICNYNFVFFFLEMKNDCAYRHGKVVSIERM